MEEGTTPIPARPEVRDRMRAVEHPPAPPADASPAAPEVVRRRRIPLLAEWGLLVGAALVVFLLLRMFALQAFYIPSESMVPTLQRDDRVLVNKQSYLFGDVGRGDIVVFDAPEDTADGVHHLVKRVVGLPGETVEGRDGTILVDGERLTEDYLPGGTASKTFGPVVVPSGSYFVLGDNRQLSEDSTVFGAIDEDAIVGRAFVRILPVDRLGLL